METFHINVQNTRGPLREGITIDAESIQRAVEIYLEILKAESPPRGATPRGTYDLRVQAMQLFMEPSNIYGDRTKTPEQILDFLVG